MNFFRTIFLTCAHFQHYRPLRDRPLSAALLYAVLLMALLSFVGLACQVPWALQLLEDGVAWVDRHVPALTLQDGRVQTAVAQPYRAGNENFLFVLDTTGNTQQVETNALQGVLVESDRLFYWIKSTNAPTALIRSQHHSLRGFPDGTVNGQYLRHLIAVFAWVGVPLILFTVIGVALILTLGQALIFAAMSSWMERSSANPLQFSQLLNIAIYAITPPSIVFTVYQALRLKNIDLWLVYLIVYGVFVVGAASACRNRQPTPQPEEDELL